MTASRITKALTVLAVAIAIPAYAARPVVPAVQQPQTVSDTAAVQTSDFEKLESLGIWTRSGEGSLGRDFWKGAKRSHLIALLQAMPANAREPAMQKLIYGALLTEADAENITNDVKPQDGPDILTLRLEKLMEGGAYNQAFKMYSQISGEVYHERLAKAGIMAMLSAGEKSLGCLEANTVAEHFSDSEFLKTVISYCNTTLEEESDMEAAQALPGLLATMAKDKSYSFAYAPDKFAALNPLERAFLASEKRINFGAMTAQQAQALPPADLQILALKEDMDPQTRLSLLCAEVGWGLISADALKDFYISAMEPAAGEDFSLPAFDSLQVWQRLPYYFYTASNAPEAERWAILRQALNLRTEYGLAALYPFVGLIEKTQPAADSSLAEMASATRVMSDSGRIIPAFWVDSVANFPNQGEKTYPDLRTVAYLSGGRKTQDRAQMSEIMYNNAEINTAHKIFLKNVIENIDRQADDIDNASEIYEKDLDLGFKDDYVMPSVYVWDRLLQAGQDKSKGETVLLSTVALRETPLQDAYPGLFMDVVTALSSVGLTRNSEDLAMAAVLGSAE